ncbi:DUF6086 family protein [Streptomyces sp. WAC07094]|uniref:DUF6086 family protein n=1 Tax=Streptomyces sp. WAC07094 TaxID=3072183 RepID=UPI002ECC8C90|nr:DUF6086 family protein [Streptomyces sp. WAC07094]
MSMYFDVGDETLWNPSNGAGRLFMRQVEVFEAELKLPSGIGQGRYWGDPDTFEVDPAVYAVFVRGLVAWYCRTGHSVIRALSEGFTATAVTLARRAGIDMEVPEPAPDHRCGDPQRDIQVSGNPRTASHDKVEALGIRAQGDGPLDGPLSGRTRDRPSARRKLRKLTNGNPGRMAGPKTRRSDSRGPDDAPEIIRSRQPLSAVIPCFPAPCLPPRFRFRHTGHWSHSTAPGRPGEP